MKEADLRYSQNKSLKNGYLQMKYLSSSRVLAFPDIYHILTYRSPSSDQIAVKTAYKSAHINNPASGSSAEFVIVRKAALF
jgi:hypothetical protein